ncbi:NAD(P)/FAD-dependent oxidoreductase [Nocardioides sp.]|uniref:NAD(P)/FAD-dependent oxidoreductase n=1 Tax=Nocardioides sp. TaxID=35761 RepID=UPI0026399241|nr:NAD(P)/FAD-dependent oxidoreductase [Nocardioides sp.]
MSEQPDVIVIGGAAAGLSAALTLGRARRRVLVLDTGLPRNRFAAHMHGVLGHDGLDPAELIRIGREECRQYDVTLTSAEVAAVTDAGTSGLSVTLTDGTALRTRAVIVASGLSDVLPDLPGLAEQWGRGVVHCPYCHGWEVRDQRLAVLATGPNSLHQVQLVRQWSDRLTFLSAGYGTLSSEEEARLRSRGIEIVTTPVAEILADDGRLSGVRLEDGRQIAYDALFTAPHSRPHDAFLAGLDLDRTENPMGSFLAVDPTGQTSHPRIWATGNVTNPGGSVPIAIGAAVLTGAMVNMALVNEEFDTALEA